VPPQPPLPAFIKPDLFELSGHGIDVAFMPVGAGGLAHFTYQDAQRSLAFTGDQIPSVPVGDPRHGCERHAGAHSRQWIDDLQRADPARQPR
jgi:hypothetical protein